jgi:protocatechuate 3,4-dioxygenase beta subunit
MANNRSRWWLSLLVLALLGLGLYRLVCHEPARSSESSANNAAKTDPKSASRFAVSASDSDEPDAEGIAHDGLALTGRVIYPDGRAAVGAMVRVLSRPSGAPHASMSRRATKTDAEGAFAFAKQAQGDYNLQAQTDDAVSPMTPARLVAGSQPVTLMVFPGGTLAVRVYNAVDRSPIAGATVKIGIGHGQLSASDAYLLERTDATGVARFRGVSRIENHPVYAAADGFTGTFDNIRATDHLSSEWEVAIALRPGAVVIGRVIDERGVPIPGAKVGWEQGAGEPDGAYTFVTPLADGGHYIAAVTDSTGSFRKAVPPGVGCLVAVHPLHLTGQVCGVSATLDRPRTGIDIVMKSGARVSGIVVNADGKPVPRAEVIVTHPSWEHIPRLSDSYRSRTTTDAEGRFAFEGVDRMQLALTAWSDERSSDLVELDLRGADERKDVRITLAYHGVITGTVTEEDGGPAPFAIVGYFLARGLDEIKYTANEADARGYALPKSIGGTLADADGKFKLAGLPPGNYTVRALRPSAVSVTPDYAAVWRYNVALGSDVTLVLPGLGSVMGRVVSDDGRPVSSFTVSFAMWDPAVEKSAMPPGQPFTSADGSFRIDDVPASRYSIAVSGPGIVEWRTKGPVELKTGGVLNLGTIQVATGVQVVGRVLSRAGEPVRNADVAMVGSDKPDIVRHAQSDDDGRFALPFVPRGTSVKVRASTLEDASDWIVVPAGVANVDLVIGGASRGSVSGVIVDPGNALADRIVLLTLPGIGMPGEGLRPEILGNAVDSGRFKLENVPAGAYILWVRRAQGKGGDEWATRAILVQPTKETSVVIDLSVQESQP